MNNIERESKFLQWMSMLNDELAEHPLINLGLGLLFGSLATYEILICLPQALK